MSEETPTQRLVITKPVLITLIAVGAALLLAIIVLLVMLLQGGDGDGEPQAGPTPSASETAVSPSPTPSDEDESSPTPTPSPSESEEQEEEAPPPPPSNDPKINSFTVSTTTVVCPESDAEFQDVPPLHFEWTTTNVSQVWFGVDTNDASTAAYANDLPGNGEIDMFIGCPVGSEEKHKYTLTVSGNGQKTHKTINVVIKP